MQKPAIILVNPQLGENIGAAARVMLNFGLDDLRLISPRDGWPNQSAVDTAKSAVKVIENAKVFSSLKDACHDITELYATTARPRDMVKNVVTPRKCAENIRKAGGRSAIMFGPERSGLSNDDIVLADSICTIPVSDEYTSLNLAQAVSIISYEWFTFADKTPEEEFDIGDLAFATKEEIAGFLSHLESELDKTDFFKIPDKKPKMLRNLSNLFIRARLTDQDVRSLRGVIRSLVGR